MRKNNFPDDFTGNWKWPKRVPLYKDHEEVWVFNPFKTAKVATNVNHRLCLKSKLQVKCHWGLTAG